ncbi:MAG: hypothetical protein AB9903_20245 [Vulcanimicrobiota bacterium]
MNRKVAALKCRFCLFLFLLCVFLSLSQTVKIPVWAVSDWRPCFSIKEGNNTNYFLLEDSVTAHLIVTNSENPRILVCFPAGNSGVALWFDRFRQENKGLTLSLSGNPRPWSCGERSSGVSFSVKSDKERVALTSFTLDSVRMIRNYGTPAERESNKLRDVYITRNSIANATPLPTITLKLGAVILEYVTVSGKRYRTEIKPAPSVKAEITKARELLLTAPEGSTVQFDVNASVPFPSLPPYSEDALFSQATLAFREDLEDNAGASDASTQVKEEALRYTEAMRSLTFLSCREKYLAGSWRFMTYFGRDTILSLMMLKDVLNGAAYRQGVQSVIDRIGDDGSVAHEEDIGTWAELRRIEAFVYFGAPFDITNAEKPLYDYKMVDDDFLFPLMQIGYLLDSRVSMQEKNEFLNRVNARNERNIFTLMRNWNYVLAKAMPFHNAKLKANKPGGNPKMKAKKQGDRAIVRSLIRIANREMVGDWRDSEQGLGRGVYPGSVNVDLVSYSINAIRRMCGSGILNLNEIEQWAETAHMDALKALMKAGSGAQVSNKLEPAEKDWQDAGRLFRVVLSPLEVSKRLKAYFEGGLLDDEKKYFLAQEIEKGITFNDFLYKDIMPASLEKGICFYALSLKEDGKPVAIMNSDMAFRLFLGRPDEEDIQECLKVLSLPFPLGLKTDAGIVVANPAFSTDPADWKILNRKAYHGTVVWSWQMYMLELGLAAQIERADTDDSVRNLIKPMKRAMADISTLRGSVGSLANSELWSWQIKDGVMVPSAFGAEAGSEDESNALQLWSTIFPAVLMKEHQILGDTK